MSSDLNPANPSLAREGQPTDQPTSASKPAVKPTVKRKVAVRKSSVEDELAAARRLIKEGQEAEARAIARKEREAKAIRAQHGRAVLPDLLARLDPTMREIMAGNLLGVAKGEETQNVQDWLATL